MTDTLADAPPADAPPSDGTPPPADAPPATDGGGRVTFTPEQQAQVDDIIAKRTARAAADARSKYEADLKQMAEREQMDAAARAQAEKNDIETAAAEKISAADRRVVAAEAKAAALAAGVTAANVKHVLKLADLDGITPDDDGYEDAVAAAVASVVADMPTLVAPAGAAGPSGGEFTPEGSTKVWTSEEIKKLTPSEYDAHRAEIMKQMQTTGIK